MSERCPGGRAGRFCRLICYLERREAAAMPISSLPPVVAPREVDTGVLETLAGAALEGGFAADGKVAAARLWALSLCCD